MKEALKLALEALENSNSTSYEMLHAIVAIKEALAQPVQEPECPKCKAIVLYECVACSSSNYPKSVQPVQPAHPTTGETE